MSENTHQYIGLDKVVFTNIIVRYIDTQKISQLKNVKIQCNPDHQYEFQKDGWGIQCISIADNDAFLDFYYSCGYYENTRNSNANLTITVSNMRRYLYPNWSGERNVCWAEYNHYLHCCMDVLEKKYGIFTNFESCAVRYMEINCNIQLLSAFETYEQPLNLLMFFLPKTMKKQNRWEALDKDNGKIKVESMQRGNNSTSFIAYNKSKQIQETQSNQNSDVQQQTDILRLELKFLTKKRVQAAFGTAVWNDLSDKQISEAFYTYFQKKMVNKYANWQKECQKKCVELLKRMQKKYRNRWAYAVMEYIRNKHEQTGMPYILDIVQLIDALKELPDPHRNISRKISSIKNIQVENDVYYNNNCEKMTEIFSGVDEAYYNTIFRKQSDA